MRLVVSLGFVVTLLTACGEERHDAAALRDAWNPVNDPLRLGDDFDYAFAALPLTGKTTREPWTDSYWPSARGGLAQRWLVTEADVSAWSYPLRTLEELRTLPAEVLRALSPAEKYDVFLGRYDYPLAQSERRRTAPDLPGWFGLCHGWAPAAVVFDEPRSVTLTNADGLSLAFGSSDVKALLTFAQQYQRSNEDSRMLGARCNIDIVTNPDGARNPECSDTNAGAFHVVLANQIAKKDEPFIADVTRDLQVWNQPVFGYDSQIVSESDVVYAGAAPGTTKIVEVKTSMLYIVEMGPAWEPIPHLEYPGQIATQEYEYALELSAEGKVLGGEWRSENRPDFMWSQKKAEFTGYFADLAEIYAAATVVP